MIFEEVRDYMLILSNQYYIGLENIEVTDEVLQGLIKRALSVYSNYRSYNIIKKLTVTKEQRLNIVNDDGIERTIINIKNIYLANPSYNTTPVTFNWKYDINTKMFYSQIGGTFYFDLLTELVLDDIDYTYKEFFDLLLGLYLMYIASPRKNFSLTELPFANDGDDLFTNGKELYENTIEKLSESDGSWYLAIQ